MVSRLPTSGGRAWSCHVRALARRTDVPVDIDVRIDERLPAPIEASAYYIASEALTNVAKHAHANVASLVGDAHSCCLPERESRFPFVRSSTARLRAVTRRGVSARTGARSGEGRLYQLVRVHDTVRERTVEITFLEPGAEAYVFSFG